MGGGKSSKQTIGYKFYAGANLVLARYISKILQVKIGDKLAWEGSNSGGDISINKDMLFGTKAEGGVVGIFRFRRGDSLQDVDPYLASKLGSNISADIGVSSLTLVNPYLGNNPYIKDIAIRGERVFELEDGVEQWYVEKAGIVNINYAINDHGQWRYKVLAYGDLTDYHAVDYDDSAWDVGEGPFTGANGYPGDAAAYGFSGTGTVVPNNRYVWMRRDLTVDNIDNDFVYEGYHDNGVELWLNGEKVIDDYGTYGHYFTTTIPKEKFVLGTNHIAVRGKDDTNTPPGGFFVFSWRIKPALAAAWDINPVHIIREALMNTEWGYGYGDADIDDANFRAVADTLYNESFGLSYFWDDDSTLDAIINKVLDHIDGVLYLDRDTLKFKIALNRNDYDPEDLIELRANIEISRIDNYKKPQFLDLINTVTVNYYNTANGGSGSLTQSNAALFLQQGTRKSVEVDYQMCCNAGLAGRLLQRELDIRTNPYSTCDVYANSAAKGLRRGSVFKLTATDYNYNQTIMRVTEISYGDGKTKAIKISCTEDRFAMPSESSVEIQDPEVPPTIYPSPLQNRMVIEEPYAMLIKRLGQSNVDQSLTSSPDVGFFGASASRNEGALTSDVYADAGAGYEDVARLDFCPFGKLVDAVDYLDTSFTLDSFIDIDELADSKLFQIDDEIMSFASLDTGTGVMTGVMRGLFDTLPQQHAAGAKVFFFEYWLDGAAEQYSDGETVNVKLLPTYSSGQLALSAAPADALDIVGRAARPYPPANVKLNGEYYPATIEGALALTWAGRDRKQQADTLHDFTEASIGPETGVTYAYEIWDTTNNIVTDSGTGIAGESTNPILSAQFNRLELWSELDSLQSFQRFIHEFEYLSILTATGFFPGGAINEAWVASFAPSGGTAPFTWSISSGALPPGWALESTTGDEAVIGGLATIAGTYDFVVQCEDANGVISTGSYQVSIGTVSYLMHFTGTQGGTTFADEAGFNWTRSGGNAIIQTAVAGPTADYGSTFQTSGGSYIYRGNEAANDISSADFTIDFWARKVGGDTYSTLFGKRTSGGQYNWSFRWYATDDKPFFTHYNNSYGNGRSNISPVAVSRNAWHHFRVCRKGSGASTVVRFWIDGAMVSETTRPDNISAQPQPLIFGDSSGGYGDDNFNGQIDEFHLVKGACFSWDDDFTPPTKPYVYNPSELAVNGTFAAGTNWTNSSGTQWTIASGVATCDGTAANASFNNDTAVTPFAAGTYRILLNLSAYTSGKVAVELYDSIGAATVVTSAQVSATGVTYLIVKAASAFDTIKLIPDATSSFVGGVDEISVKKLD